MLSLCREFWVLPPPQTRNTVFKWFCVSEKLSVAGFKSILPLKMCPGSRRKWVGACAMPCFSEHGHYRRSAETERETQTNREVRLGCFAGDYCFTPWSFLFLLSSGVPLIFPSPCLQLPLLSSYLLFCLLFLSPHLPPPLILCHISPHLISTLRLLFWFIWWAGEVVHCTENGK